MTQAVNRRRKGLVSRRFQVGLAWRFLIVFLVLFSCGMAMIFVPSLVGVATGVHLEELEGSAAELLILHRRIWPAALFVAVGMFLYTLWLSHRIAGPVYRINTVLRQLLDGNPPPGVGLRKGDFFHETAALLDELVRRGEESLPSPPHEAGRGKAGGAAGKRRGAKEEGAGAAEGSGE